MSHPSASPAELFLIPRLPGLARRRPPIFALVLVVASILHRQVWWVVDPRIPVTASWASALPDLTRCWSVLWERWRRTVLQGGPGEVPATQSTDRAPSASAEGSSSSARPCTRASEPVSRHETRHPALEVAGFRFTVVRGGVLVAFRITLRWRLPALGLRWYAAAYWSAASGSRHRRWAMRPPGRRTRT